MNKRQRKKNKLKKAEYEIGRRNYVINRLKEQLRQEQEISAAMQDASKVTGEAYMALVINLALSLGFETDVEVGEATFVCCRRLNLPEYSVRDTLDTYSYALGKDEAGAYILVANEEE